MKATLLRLWREHRMLLAAFSLAAALTLFFAGWMLVAAIHWSNPENRNVKVQPWMTVGYVGRSWDIDPREIDRIAGLPLPQGHPLPLSEIAAQRGVPVEDIIKQVEDAIAMVLLQRMIGK